MAGRGAGWYWALGGQVLYFKTDPGAEWHGPYATKAEAEAAAHGGGGGGGGSGGDYWVINEAQHGGFFVVQSSTRPPNAVAGPFKTAAAADAWISAHAPSFPSLPNPLAPLAWLQDVGHWIGTAVAYITDGAMWRSIGWIALGGLLLIIGIILWWRSTEAFKNINAEIAAAIP